MFNAPQNRDFTFLRVKQHLKDCYGELTGKRNYKQSMKGYLFVSKSLLFCFMLRDLTYC